MPSLITACLRLPCGLPCESGAAELTRRSLRVNASRSACFSEAGPASRAGARHGGSAAMPYADTVATVRSWAEERAIAVWTLFAGDLPMTAQAALAAGLDEVRADGAEIGR